MCGKVLGSVLSNPPTAPPGLIKKEYEGAEPHIIEFPDEVRWSPCGNNVDWTVINEYFASSPA